MRPAVADPRGAPVAAAAAPDVEDDVARLLARLPALPLQEHAATYEQVHQALQQALARLDEG